ncbi:MAG: ATP-binding cassette domain-containing protein [Deltaproteobacteria bacterium]|nr:ATP-binding cassette domain-containing protein [Deltaproteobacteria bacterium]
MIKVEHLTKRYAAVDAVDDISFEIGKHEIVGFLGPNGAGKSTTLKVLTCSHGASSGKVTIDGKDIFEDAEGVKTVIGYLPENVPLYPELRVREYLTYRAGLKGISRAYRNDAINKSIARCRIKDVEHRIIGQLSKGYRQRVGLADALLADPKILILDEPTVGLDPNQIRDVRELIKALGRERTVILSSHILPEVEAVCSRVIIINKGKIVGQGRPGELRAQLQQRGQSIVVEVKDPNSVAFETLKRIPGIESITVKNSPSQFQLIWTPGNNSAANICEQIFDAAVARGFKLLGMQSIAQSLEDIFVEIITQESDAAATADFAATDGQARPTEPKERSK